VSGNKDSDGPRASFDLELEPLDISEMESLSLWIKTKGSTLHDSHIVLVDSMGNSRSLKIFYATSFPQWTKLDLNLDEFDLEDSGFNENSVAEFSIRSPWGAFMKSLQMEIFLDDIKMTKQIVSLDEPETKYLTVSTNKDAYYAPEPISVSGQITSRESDLPVTIQVFNMQQELVQIEQFVPNPDNTFNFTISTVGKQFQKEGVYHIKAQYGVQEHTAGWAFSMLISSPFPVPNDILLEIWNSRQDLQITLPEVSGGNFENLKEWAQKTGWNQDERLSALIPEGKTPDYMKPTQPEVIPEILEQIEPPKSEWNEESQIIIMVLISILIAGGISYFVFFRKRTSSFTSVSN